MGKILRTCDNCGVSLTTTLGTFCECGGRYNQTPDVLNLTLEPASKHQRENGVFDPSPCVVEEIRDALLLENTEKLATIINNTVCDAVLIGNLSPSFMKVLMARLESIKGLHILEIQFN